MKFILSILLILSSNSSFASDSYCSKSTPNLCVQMQNPNGSNTETLGSFTLQFNAPAEILDLDLMWETDDKEYAVVTVPMKITKIDEMSFKVEGVLTMIEGLWTVRIKISPTTQLNVPILVN